MHGVLSRELRRRWFTSCWGLLLLCGWWGAPALAAQTLGTWASHTCSVTAAGTVKCWGSNQHGQLGNGTTVDSNIPVDVIGITNAVSVTAGSTASCAVLADGGVHCWGANAFGELSDGTRINRLTPVAALGLGDVVSVTLRDTYGCALIRDGTVRCWGNYGIGFCFPGDPSCPPPLTGPPPLPAEVVGVSEATSIAGGLLFACAARSDGRVQCFPTPVDGAQSYIPALNTVDGIVDAVSVHAAEMGMCALLRTGTVRCWRGSFDSMRQFVVTSFINMQAQGVQQLAVGFETSCGVIADGTLQCWEFNDFGGFSMSAPIQQPGIQAAVEVAMGYSHACARLADASLRCWGKNGVGQLGNGARPYADTPVPVQGVAEATVAAALGDNTCVIVTGGIVRCWGARYAASTEVPGLVGATGLTLSYLRGCATLSNGSVKCWRLGSSASTIDSIGGVRGVSLDYADFFTCFLLESKVTCSSGASGPALRSIDVTGTSGSLAIASGFNESCVVASGGSLRCWRHEYYDPSTGNSYASVESRVVAGLGNVTAIAIGTSKRGDDAYCAISFGTVKCWGSNESGQLGNGSVSNQPAALANVVGIGAGRATSVSVGNSHSCATLVTGSVWCWGANERGQLGNRSTTSSSTAVRVNGIANAVSVAVGTASCATLADGAVKCWGEDRDNLLGNNVDLSLPVRVVGSPFLSAWSPLPPGLTGIWYEPATSGQGFNFEVLGMDRLLLLFNGYTEAGESLTLTGDYTHSSGALFGKTLTVPVYQTQGRGFSHFDPASILRTWWGEATLTLLDCSRASVQLTGLDGSQRMDMVQLSRPAGLACAP